MYSLVTGASSGIGLAYATALARDYKSNLLLVSNQLPELKALASSLHAEYGVEAKYMFVDLSMSDAAEQVYQYCQDERITIDVLVNNAGMLIFNPLHKTDIKRIETLLMLHVVTLTKLTRLFAADMAARRTGYILNMSSMSAWMAMPGIQCYNASKGYVFNFSRALWYEMKPYGVHVLAATPGSTATGLLPFSPGFDKFLKVLGITMPPERLVKRVLYVLFNTKRKRCMPGAWNYIIVPIINHLPDWFVLAAMKRFSLFA